MTRALWRPPKPARRVYARLTRDQSVVCAVSGPAIGHDGCRGDGREDRHGGGLSPGARASRGRTGRLIALLFARRGGPGAALAQVKPLVGKPRRRRGWARIPAPATSRPSSSPAPPETPFVIADRSGRNHYSGTRRRSACLRLHALSDDGPSGPLRTSSPPAVLRHHPGTALSTRSFASARGNGRRGARELFRVFARTGRRTESRSPASAPSFSDDGSCVQTRFATSTERAARVQALRERRGRLWNFRANSEAMGTWKVDLQAGLVRPLLTGLRTKIFGYDQRRWRVWGRSEDFIESSSIPTDPERPSWEVVRRGVFARARLRMDSSPDPAGKRRPRGPLDQRRGFASTATAGRTKAVRCDGRVIADVTDRKRSVESGHIRRNATPPPSPEANGGEGLLSSPPWATSWPRPSNAIRSASLGTLLMKAAGGR
jgi:hypothetical protein